MRITRYRQSNDVPQRGFYGVPRRLIYFAVLVLSLGSFSADAKPNFMPSIVSENLNEEMIQIPSGLPQERTLMILAFQREQQENVETWIAGMKLADSPVPWLEVPVIDNPGMLGRWFINAGMRRGIPDDYTRAHVVSLYPDKAEFLKPLGIGDENAVYALVVTRKGEVVAEVKGDYSPTGANKIWQALSGK